MLDVITIGSAVRDVFLVSKAFKMIRSNKFAGGIGECVGLGSKIEVDQLVLSTGGGASNAAATFRNFGASVGVVTRIGDDPTGDDILRELATRRIDTTLVKVIKGGQTGYSTLLTAANGERSILVHRGVSADFESKDIPVKRLNAHWIYVSSLAGNVEILKKIATHVTKKKIHFAFNPGSRELKKGLRALAPIFEATTVLNMNLEEAQLLTKLKTNDIRKLAAKIPHGDILLITDGPRGAYAAQGETVFYARTTGAKSLSRTGAGDAFGSGFVSTLLEEMSIEDALRIATLNAEAVIQQHGAKNGLLKKWPSKKELARISVKQI